MVFVHPKQDILELVLAANGGLFFATADGVGFVRDKVRFEFLTSPGSRLRLSGDSLHIQLGSLSRGV